MRDAAKDKGAMKSRCEAGATQRTVTPEASNGGVAPASSEFGRVVLDIVCTDYLSSLLQLRFTAGVKRLKLRVKCRGEGRLTRLRSGL
jgi:hypothetical protein